MTSPVTATPAHRGDAPDTTRALLCAGEIAGPFYVLFGLLQILIRPGFDIRHHALSLMSNGDLGWVQIGNFILSGCLVIACAVGMRRVLSPGRGGTWGPLLLGIYGLGLIGAGLFVADPMDGFPLGTPAGPPVSPTSHGAYHFMAGGIGFFALIATCMVIARRYAGLGKSGWAAFSIVTGVSFFAAFGWIASGSRHPALVPVFTAAVVLTWGWLFAVARQLRREVLGG